MDNEWPTVEVDIELKSTRFQWRYDNSKAATLDQFPVIRHLTEKNNRLLVIGTFKLSNHTLVYNFATAKLGEF